MMRHIDPILMEVISNNLLSIAEQAGITLIKCAFSPNIKERRDCSTALLSARGQVVAQATHIPMHLGSMLNVGEGILKKYGPENIRPGDVFINNDPYLGGSSHLSDFTITTPVFFEDKLIFFAVNTAHHVDVGGRVPGSTSPDCQSIFEEGVRIPLVKIMAEGRLNEEMLELICWNCRDPEERKADAKGQIAANYITEKPIVQLCRKYGAEFLQAAVDEILCYTETRIKAKIREFPDGIYEFINHMDNDGIRDITVPIRVKVTIKGDSARVDFTGTGEQAAGAMNAVRSALLAGVYFAFKAAIDPEILPNEGFFRAIDIYAPLGTILNPRPNAAVGVRLDTVQKAVDVILGALFQAMPKGKVVAGSCATSGAWLFYGHDPKKGKDFCYIETFGGGSGARSNKDGLDGVQVYTNNTSNLPIEALESEYPLVVEQYSLVRDSGGSGKYRGGMGLRRDIRTLHDAFLTTRSEGHKTNPWGIHGGKAGAPGRVFLNPDTPNEISIPAKKGNIPLRAGDIVSIRTPGAGGFGDPAARDPEQVLKDIRGEVISVGRAEADYPFIREKLRGIRT